MSINVYVPRDERFGHLKFSDALAYGLKAIAQFLKPELEAPFDRTPNEFDSLQDILNLYEGGIALPNDLLENIRDHISAEMLKELLRTDGERLLKFPLPQVIKGTSYICNFEAQTYCMKTKFCRLLFPLLWLKVVIALKILICFPFSTIFFQLKKWFS